MQQQQLIKDNDELYISTEIGDDKEFTPKQLAIGFGCHVNTIYNHIQSGRIKAVKRFGYKISRQAVASFLKSSTDF